MKAARQKFEFLPPTLRRELAKSPERAEQIVTRSAAWVRSLLQDPAMQKLLRDSPLMVKGQEIAVRLSLGVQEMLGSGQTGDSLHPLKVGMFLALISDPPTDDLAWYVRTGLENLGIKRSSRQGRPKGRKSETEHFISFKVSESLIEQTQLWNKKQQFMQESPSKGDTHLRNVLRTDGWSPEVIGLTVACHSPRSLALHMAALECMVEYDTIRRSVQRYSRRIPTPAKP